MGILLLRPAGLQPYEILAITTVTASISTQRNRLPGSLASWPGYDLTVGSSGDKVRQLQEQLDAIAQIYTAIPRIQPDGIYGQQTAAAVREFQNIFGLPQTGVTDFATWYKISLSMWGSHGSQSCIDHAFHTFLPPLWAA